MPTSYANASESTTEITRPADAEIVAMAKLVMGGVASDKQLATIRTVAVTLLIATAQEIEAGQIEAAPGRAA